MTGENRAENIATEWREGARCLQAADALLVAGLFKDALNRAYYAAYHFCLALLLSTGEEPRTHRGLVSLVGTEFVKKGLVAASVQHALARLATYREYADYDRDFVATGEMVELEMRSARDVRDEVERHLRKQGFAVPG